MACRRRIIVADETEAPSPPLASRSSTSPWRLTKMPEKLGTRPVWVGARIFGAQVELPASRSGAHPLKSRDRAALSHCCSNIRGGQDKLLRLFHRDRSALALSRRKRGNEHGDHAGSVFASMSAFHPFLPLGPARLPDRRRHSISRPNPTKAE